MDDFFLGLTFFGLDLLAPKPPAKQVGLNAVPEDAWVVRSSSVERRVEAVIVGKKVM